MDELQQQLQRQEQRAAQQQAALQEELQHWKQQYAELQEQSRQQQEHGLQQLSDRLKEAISQKQEVHVRLSAQLGDLQQQLHDSNAAALQAAAEKSALTAQLAAAEQAKGERTVFQSDLQPGWAKYRVQTRKKRRLVHCVRQTDLYACYNSVLVFVC